MATVSTIPPPAPSSETTKVKLEPPELTNTSTITIHPPTTNTPQNHPPPPPPHFINSVNELRNLSAALSSFLRRYDELQGHLDFIRTTIDSKLPNHHQQLSLIPSPPNQLAIIPSTETLTSNTDKTAVFEAANSEQKPNKKTPSRSELENLCEMMCSRGLRRYLITNLSDIKKLREETPKALKLAPNPAKLVLECFGRFFLQGIRAYTKDSPMIPAREASVLVLECFLVMGCDGIEIESSVKEEAHTAAVAWRKRLVSEGGLTKACEMDARGLLLVISCFGIPDAFKNADVRDLILSANAREISGVLRRSSVLIAKIPEIIDGMVKNKMEIEAVDSAYTFELEERFHPQTILTSFLRESKDAWKRRTRNGAQASFAALKEAHGKHLADLKSVIKCLEDHKIDPSKLLPGWQINEKIVSLEKALSDLNTESVEKAKPKRKVDETESSKNLKTQDVKRSRFGGHVPQQPQAVGHADAKGPYDGWRQMNLLDGGLPAHINSYSASPSSLYGSGPGPLHENIGGSIAAGAGLSVGSGGVLPTGSYAGLHGGMVVDTVGQMMTHNGQPYGWRGDAALNERLVGHSFAGQPSSVGLIGLYRPAPSLEGFAGLPNPSSVGVSSRSSASDLYQFADAVLETESYHSSGARTVGTVPPVMSTHHPSYLY